jgi:lysophospholipase L1-like esterase
MKECANEDVDIRIAFGSRNTMTATLTPVPATSTHTLTPTTDNTNVVATTSPTLTYTPTKVADNMHINNLNAVNIYNETDGSAVVRGDSTKTMWGDPTQRNIMQGSDYTISSEGPVTIDADGSVIEKHTTDGASGTSGGYRVLVDYNTPVVYRNYRIPTTHTPVAGVNDFVGEEHFGEYKVRQPESTNTPSADELPKWSWVKSYVDYNPIQKSLTSSKGLLIGDSIMVETAATPVIGSMDSYLLTNSDSLLGTTCYNQSVAGQGIAEQKAIWVSDANKATYDWIIIQVGINNLVTPSEAATEVIADYQDFVDTINAGKKSTCALLASTLSPDYSVLVDLLGNTAGAAAYQKWLDVNEAIGGGGSTPVTGVHVHITEISDALNDGNGNLAYKYSYDGIHPNEAGRKVMAGIYRKHLNRLGFLANGSLIDKSGNPPMVSPVSMTVAQRDNLPAATIGDVVYNSTSKTLDYLFGDGWKSAGSIIKSATVTGPNPVSVGLDVDVAYCDTSAGSFVYRLPLATGSGRVIKFKKTSNDTNFVSVWTDTTGTPDLIDGQAAIGLTTQYETLQIQDGAVNNWYTLSHDFVPLFLPQWQPKRPLRVIWCVKNMPMRA